MSLWASEGFCHNISVLNRVISSTFCYYMSACVKELKFSTIIWQTMEQHILDTYAEKQLS